MCLVVIAFQAHAAFPLVVGANRDEYYHRPAAAAHFWPDAPHVLAGRDLQAGGTWLGITTGGRFAAVTNVRPSGSEPVAGPSRGTLVSGFLNSGETAATYGRCVAAEGARYAGFNLLLYDGTDLVCCSNRHPDGAWPLPAGVHAFSNAPPQARWPKVERGRQRLQRLLADPAVVDADALLDLLGDRTLPDEAPLPATGLEPARERALAPVCVATPDYGTRCSTVALFDTAGHVAFYERPVDAGVPGREVVHHTFRVAAA